MSQRRPTIADMWSDFEGRVVPHAAGVRQRREMKAAFYAGALTAFNATYGLDTGEEPTEADLAYVSALYEEINVFLVNDIDRRFREIGGGGTA